MPDYENPLLPEGVNVSRDNPLVEFARLVAGLALVATVAGLTLYFGGSRLARLVPFETEAALVGDSVLGIGAPEAGKSGIADYLQEVTDRLAAEMMLPANMKLRVHYIDTPVPNAFAALGGHIAVTRGLYEAVKSENALAMVLAHEIAHVRARDPIAGLGGSATLVLALALVSGDAANLSSAFARIVQSGYSRRAEAEADGAAIEALRRVYGHAGGGTEVFETFARYHEDHGGELPSLLSTHPLDAQRIERLKLAEQDWDAQRQPLRPIRPTT
ncbi:MAG: M48 family metallopeptidase [Candidatus Binatia bacterium]